MPADPLDLTTVAAVRSRLQHDDTVGVDNDDEVQALITRASRSVMDFTGREFVSAASGSTARTFLYYNTPDQVLPLTPYDARTVTQLRFDTDTASPSTVTDSTQWRLLPIPSRYGAYHALYLPQHTGTVAGRVVEVTGTWGWPSVPQDIEGATIDTVVHWLRQQMPGGQVVNEDTDRYGPVQFPTSARMVLRRYRMVRV